MQSTISTRCIAQMSSLNVKIKAKTHIFNNGEKKQRQRRRLRKSEQTNERIKDSAVTSSPAAKTIQFPYWCVCVCDLSRFGFVIVAADTAASAIAAAYSVLPLPSSSSPSSSSWTPNEMYSSVFSIWFEHLYRNQSSMHACVLAQHTNIVWNERKHRCSRCSRICVEHTCFPLFFSCLSLSVCVFTLHLPQAGSQTSIEHNRNTTFCVHVYTVETLAELYVWVCTLAVFVYFVVYNTA